MSRRTMTARSPSGSSCEGRGDPLAVEGGVGPQLGVDLGPLVDERASRR